MSYNLHIQSKEIYLGFLMLGKHFNPCEGTGRGKTLNRTILCFFSRLKTRLMTLDCIKEVVTCMILCMTTWKEIPLISIGLTPSDMCIGLWPKGANLTRFPAAG